MKFIRALLAGKDADIKQQIQEEKSLLNNNRQALRSGAALLTTMSNALSLMADEEDRENATHHR